MLQQTRVEQGLSYYLKFIDHYPKIEDLAAASEDEVLNLWQGLGYYSRARNMHTAAKVVTDHYKGVFPDNYEEIRQLKGVGDYTAAAIASIAFDEPKAVVDGNVYRVLARYLSEQTPIDSTKGKKLFQTAAEEFLDHDHPGDHNQALMELGSLICTPKNPDCDACPVRDGCLARASGTQTEFPVKSKKTKVRNRFFNYLIIEDGKNLLIRKRPAGDIWQGMYDFPMIEKDKVTNQIEIELLERNPKSVRLSGTLTHILSHQKLHAQFWVVTVDEVVPKDEEIAIPIDSIEDYPLPVLLIRYIETADFFGVD